MQESGGQAVRSSLVDEERCNERQLRLRFASSSTFELQNTTTMAASAHKVQFLIVPGSFSTPPAYDVLVAQLRSQGHEARVVELLSANDGSRLPPATGADDVQHIRDAVLAVLDSDNDPSDVVLAAHSYGGMPTTSALQGLNRAERSAQGKKTSVIGLVYIASFMVPVGGSLREFMSAEGIMPEPSKTGVPGGYMPVLDPASISFIFNDIDESKRDDIVNKYLPTFTSHSSDSFDYKTTYEAWRDIPSVYLIPGNDLIVPAHAQLKMFENALANGGQVTKVFVEGAGHALNVSQPELVAAEMIKLAEAQS